MNKPPQQKTAPPVTPTMHVKSVIGTLGKLVDTFVSSPKEREEALSDPAFRRAVYLMSCQVSSLMEIMDDDSAKAANAYDMAQRLEENLRIWMRIGEDT